MARKKPEKIVHWKEDWRHLAWVGGLILCVLLTLSLGAAMAVDQAQGSSVVSLDADPGSGRDLQAGLPADWVSDEEEAPLPEEPADDEADGFQSKAPAQIRVEMPPSPVVSLPAPKLRPAAEPERLPAQDQPLGELRARIRSDTRRLQQDESRWTLQFLVTQEAAKAGSILQQLDGDSNLHILPVNVKGVDCYRICWGSYPSRESATSADVPALLHRLNASPMPRSVRDLSG